MRVETRRGGWWGGRLWFGRLSLLAVGFVMGMALSQTTARGAVEQQDAQAIAIPQTPAGGHLEWFLRALNTQELPGLEEFDARLTDEFRAQVPALQLLNTTKMLKMQLGELELRGVREFSAHSLVATLHSAMVNAPFALSVTTEDAEPFRMTGLMLRPLPRQAPAGDTWEKIDESLVALGDQVSIAAMRVNGDAGFVPVHMLYEDLSLAIGSTFKLWVLGALGEAVREGAMGFGDALAIRDSWKSLPSGTMQLEVAGKEFPLREYAEKMISISDNTATDHLLLHVGRERVEAFMRRFVSGWERNVPVLTTRDMFALKLGEDETLAERFLEKDADGRRAMLEGEVSTARMNLQQLWHLPRRIDTLEWFASAEELCETVAWLAREGQPEVVGAMSKNPGVQLDREKWVAFAYKGGSEPGVMNLTWWLKRSDGVEFALSVGVNDTARPLNETAIVEIAQRAVALLEGWGR